MSTTSFASTVALGAAPAARVSRTAARSAALVPCPPRALALLAPRTGVAVSMAARARPCARRAVALRVRAAAEPAIEAGSVSVVLLAGGVGKRMGAAIPKQYLDLRGKPIATWSLLTFGAMPEVGEIVIVCDPSWRELFEAAFADVSGFPPVKWALPGAERQDSVSNGLDEICDDAALVAIHDSARPMVKMEDMQACIADALEVGAAVLGVPVKPTIKQVGPDGMVECTLVRSKLWDVQTPQIIKPSLLREGFRKVAEENLEVTDDVSIIEAMGLPVKMTKGDYTNIKVTTPEDMFVAERFIDEMQTVTV